MRGTVSTGFRAPTLAEDYYSVTNVGPGFAAPVLPANSTAAKLLGFSNLKPERSDNYSAGLVLRPLPHLTLALTLTLTLTLTLALTLTLTLTLTADAYQISIRNRIVSTGGLLGEYGRYVFSQAILDAIAASGLTLPAQGGYVATSTFINSARTRTRGIEVSANYASDFAWGHVDWSFGANYTKTRATHLALASPALGEINAGPLLNSQALAYLTTAQPRYKINLGAFWIKGRWSVNLRETIYGPTSLPVNPSGTGNPPNYVEKIATTGITDLELGFDLAKRLHLAAGANNLFNKRPPTAPLVPALGGAGAGVPDPGQVYFARYYFSPYGVNGGYYYGRISYNF